MPPHRTGRPPQPGAIFKLCACGNAMGHARVACKKCWTSLPVPLRDAYLAVKDTPGPGLEAALEAIRTHLREAVRA